MANIYKVNYTYLIFFWCFVSHFAYPQQPFTQYYSPENYRGAGQNWDVIQGKSGMVYVANNDGMLQYDGLQWKLFTLPKKAFMYSLALASDGRIFVGGVDELGYFKRNPQGKWVFTSLKAQLNQQVKQIKTIYKTKIIGNKVIFLNNRQTFVYENQQFKVINIGRFNTFVLKDKLYFRREGKLWLYQQGKLQVSGLITGFDISRLNFILPWKDNQWMLINRNNQIWIYNAQAPNAQQRIQLANWQYDDELNKGEYFVKAMRLPNQQIALCSFERLFILDKEGKLLHKTNISSKAINNNINGLHYDHQGNLWLAMNYGIKTVMLNSPLTHRSSKDGFRGVIYSLGNNGDYTYIGTNHGVYYYTKQSPQIKKVKGVYNDCWNFYNHDGITFLANTYGVFQITDSTAKWLTRYTYVHSLAKLKAKNHFVVGTYNIGIWLLKKENEEWESHRIKGFDKETRFIEEGDQGHLWVAHYNEGVYKLKLNLERDSVIKQTYYGTKEGLPSTQNTRVYRLNNGKLVFTTIKGFYEYNATQDRFEPIKAFNQALGDKYCVYTFREDTQGNLYCWLGQGAPYNREVLGVLKKQANGTFKLITSLFNNIEVATNGLRVDVDAPVMISPSQNKVLIGNLSKLLIYDVDKSANIKQNYQVIIRKFRAGDSSIFRYGNKAQNIVLSYAMHNIDIHYAAMTYENIHKTRYSYWLKGFDTKWSAWRTQPESNFTNLPEGKYTFMVKARNVYGKESQISAFSFQILPPWYRTWWAYTLYVVFSIGVIGLIAWLNSRRLIRQKIVLEQIVKERTDEVMSQNEELKQNQDEILAQRGYIEDQNKHLLQKNTMIQQSIKSALTIQQAFLPSEARVKSFLPKSFIVYQPKDIVSGDFYWIEKVGNKTIVIAADCTGHGVPGAFMSLIGYNLFNKIILQQGYHNPVEILDQLHEQVAIALKQPESNNINGMDLIILIMEDTPQGATQLTFAGARRPLYYLLPDQKETLHVVKGTRKSIGGLQNKRVSFQLHELLLPKASLLYVGSDGLVDQNNPDRKKFGAKRLEELLQKIAWLPLEEQKATIEQELTKHMQGATQRDDILWMGIKT